LFSTTHNEFSPLRVYRKFLCSIVPEKSLNHLSHDDFVVCFIFCKFQRGTTSIAFSPYLVTEIWLCQNLLGKDLTRCFMIISMYVVQSLSISSLRPKRKSVHYESFENCIFEILSGNSSNHLFHGDFDVCGIFCNL